LPPSFNVHIVEASVLKFHAERQSERSREARQMLFRRLSFAAATAVFLAPAGALAACDLDQLLGYTLIAEKHVSGFVQNAQWSDGFEGCSYGRTLVFDDNTGLLCLSYSYSSSRHPKAYIFSNGASMKACISDSLYDVAPIQ